LEIHLDYNGKNDMKELTISDGPTHAYLRMKRGRERRGRIGNILEKSVKREREESNRLDPRQQNIGDCVWEAWGRVGI